MKNAVLKNYHSWIIAESRNVARHEMHEASCCRGNNSICWQYWKTLMSFIQKLQLIMCCGSSHCHCINVTQHQGYYHMQTDHTKIMHMVAQLSFDFGHHLVPEVMSMCENACSYHYANDAYIHVTFITPISMLPNIISSKRFWTINLSYAKSCQNSHHNKW